MKQELCKCGIVLTEKHIGEHVYGRATYVIREEPQTEPQYQLLERLNNEQLCDLFTHYWTLLSGVSDEAWADPTDPTYDVFVWIVKAFIHECTRRITPPEELDNENHD